MLFRAYSRRMNFWRTLLSMLIIGALVVFAASCGSQKKATAKRKPTQHSSRTSPRTTSPSSNTTKPSPKANASIRSKYASKLGVSAGTLKNEALYQFIDGWIGIPYKYGGTNKSGVDCSGFVGTLYREVYKRNLPRTTSDQRKASIKVSKNSLREGDLVFFSISGKDSHVGVFLANNHFVHASTSKGVIISSLTNSYYQKVFAAGGRF